MPNPNGRCNVQEGVPYITSDPVVTVVDLTSEDRFLILATDGVWEQLSNQEAVQCVEASLSGAARSGSENRGANPTSPTRPRRQRGAGAGEGGAFTSDALVDHVLSRSAHGHKMTLAALKALPRGASRRMLHDDICATVINFGPRVQSSSTA